MSRCLARVKGICRLFLETKKRVGDEVVVAAQLHRERFSCMVMALWFTFD